jgi:hypothetical protein
MKIPSNNRWTQLNEGEFSGVLNETTNMSFDSTGQAQLSKKPVAILSSADDGDVQYVVSIVYFDGAYTVVTTDAVFQGGLSGNAFTKEGDFTPSTTLASDAIVFDDKLIVTTNNNFVSWTGSGTESSGLGTLTDGVPHPMCIFDSNPTYKLAIGNGNTVKTYNTSFSANPTTLTLPTEFIVTTLRYRNGFLYVGTKNKNGGEARIFIWNGSGTNAQYECPVGAEWVFSMTEYGQSVVAIVSSGQLIEVVGSTYRPLASLPVFNTPNALWQGASGFTLTGKVFNRGMTTVGNNIYINIDGNVENGYVPTMKSGIWVYDPEVGLYHRATYSTDKRVSDTSFTVAHNVITTGANHNLSTGDGVTFKNVGGITGVDVDTLYFVTVLSANTIKLSLSRYDLASERYVDVSGTRTTASLLYYPNTDNGSRTGVTAGAIISTSFNESPIPLLETEVMWGGVLDDQNTLGSTPRWVLNAFSNNNNKGELITQRIYSNAITETWKDLYTFLDGIVTPSDKITVKIQTSFKKPSAITEGVWLNSKTINSVSTKLNSIYAGISIGDEIRVTEGSGRGKTVTVVGISESTSVFSIEVDEEIGTAGKGTEFYLTNFHKIGEFGASTKEDEYIQAVLLEKNKSPWIKIKIGITGADVAINMFDLPSISNKNA